MKSIISIFLFLLFLFSAKTALAQTCPAGTYPNYTLRCIARQCRPPNLTTPNSSVPCGHNQSGATTYECYVFSCGTPPQPLPPGAPGSAGWYAPDGSSCNRTNYHTYYALPSCTGKAGFVTEGISPQSNCSPSGSGKCYLATGSPLSQQTKSLWKQDAQSCLSLPVPQVPANAYDTLFTCRFGTAPSKSINGVVRVNFVNSGQFDKILVWITDSQIGYSHFYELPKAQIINGRPIAYNFSNLFPDKKYDVYVKAYGQKGVYLDKVTYLGSCGSPGCRSYPSATFDFNLAFPRPLAGTLTNQVSNEIFQRMIDQWIGGQITPVQMSLFISQIARVPGLQKGSCDPKVPGGCTL